MSLEYRGVNLASYAFDDSPPFEYGKTYVMPGFDEQTGTTWNGGSLDYFVSKGMNCFPLQLQWELVQPANYGPLDETYMKRVDRFVAECATRNVTVILTLRFKALRYGLVMSQPIHTDVCAKLAVRYKDKFNVLIDLMCEPAAIKVENWVACVNMATAAMRNAGYTRPIIVCLGGYAGARSAYETWYGEKSTTALLRVTDPNVIFNVHQYNDSDWSGTFVGDTVNFVGDTVNEAVPDLQRMTDWARANKKKLILGEYGGPNTEKTRVQMVKTLEHIRDNPEWVGACWWAAGPWFGGYPLSLEPTKDSTGKYVDKPQMAWLAPFLAAPPSDADKLVAWLPGAMGALLESFDAELTQTQADLEASIDAARVALANVSMQAEQLREDRALLGNLISELLKMVKDGVWKK